MNKKLKLFTLAAIAVIAIGACKKDKTVEPEPENSCKITKLEGFTNGSLNVTVPFTYDANGRLTGFTTSFTGGSDVITFTYATNKITINDDGTVVDVTLVNGRAVKSQEVSGDKDSQEFTYNADGYLTMVKNFENGTTYSDKEEFVYVNGNITKKTRTDIATGEVQEVNYEYSTTDLNNNNIAITNPVLNDILDYYIPVEYMGKLSKNVVVKQSSSYVSGTYRNENTNTYIYTKDSKGNYTSIEDNEIDKSYLNNVLNSNNTSNYKYNFTYSCN